MYRLGLHQVNDDGLRESVQSYLCEEQLFFVLDTKRIIADTLGVGLEFSHFGEMVFTGVSIN